MICPANTLVGDKPHTSRAVGRLRNLKASRVGGGRPHPVGAIEFASRTEGFAAKYAALWREVIPLDFSSEPTVSDEAKLDHERQADLSLEQVERLLRQYPRLSRPHEAWRGEFLSTLRQLGRGCLGYPEAGLSLMFTEEAFEATHRFIREAKRFDPRLSDDSLFQALRNLWVFQCLQVWLGAGVSFSPASFAYSMLYPCTDNFLDDPQVAPSAKAAFGLWLESRLLGAPAAPSDSGANEIARLVSLIEDAFPRPNHPEVFLSLHAIHQAQMSSLRQHGRGRDEGSLLAITVRKGGASVLTDAYLVRGRLTPEEADFAFGFGVLLQFMDDLQDLRQDHANAHSTLLTRQAALGPIDCVVRRLWAFAQAVLRDGERPDGLSNQPLKALIQDNCKQMILQTVALNPDLFGPAFARDLESKSAFRFSFLRQREKTLAARGKKVVAALRRRCGDDAAFGVL